jgi:hypothetical protein
VRNPQTKILTIHLLISHDKVVDARLPPEMSRLIQQTSPWASNTPTLQSMMLLHIPQHASADDAGRCSSLAGNLTSHISRKQHKGNPHAIWCTPEYDHASVLS